MRWPACGSALALALAVSACGGGGSGVSSTPTPTPSPSPSPTPAPTPSPSPTPPSYTPLSSLVTGSYSFQTAGVSFNANAPSGFTNGAGSSIGNGVSIAYNASNDTFTVSAPGGVTQSFNGSNLQPAPQGTVQLVKIAGTVTDSLLITVPLTYAMVTVWNRTDSTTGNTTGRVSVGGSPTIASDVPKTGTANYNVTVGAAARANNTTYNLTSSTGSFTANFAAGTVNTTLTLAGPPETGGAVANFGSFTGTGSIAANSPNFSGTMSGGSSSGPFSGAFFGPQAAEMGYGFVLSGLGFSAAGVAFGGKQ